MHSRQPLVSEKRGLDQRCLKSGGINYSFIFPDPDGTGEKVSVELGVEPLLLTRLTVSFSGTSLSDRATFTERKEIFLRDLLASTHPDISIAEVAGFVRREQTRRYDGGSEQMPRVPVGTASMFTGSVGVRLVIGLQR